MPPAALKALYTGISQSRDINYKNLHNTDVKKLAHILRNYPDDPSSDKTYIKSTKNDISDLPHHLRSSNLNLGNPEDKDGKVKPGKLCSTHNGLNQNIINPLWNEIRHEFDRGIGTFIYPVIMFAGLPQQQEVKIRQLEPVLEMWQKDFDIVEHTPPNREQIRPMEHVNGNFLPKWGYQQNECVACMLARIASDKDVLYALLAGIVARYTSRHIGTKNDIRSRRVRFFRYWLRKFDPSDKLANQAWDFGKELKRVRKAWREYQDGPKGKDFYGRRKTGVGSILSTPGSPIIPIDISTTFDPGFKQTIRDANNDSRNGEDTVSDVGVDISEPFTIPHSPALRHQAPQIYSRLDPNAPPSHASVQQPRNNGYAQPQSPVGSVHSRRGSIHNTNNFEWESVSSLPSYDTSSSEQETHNHRTHGSLVPAPLQTPNQSPNQNDQLPMLSRRSMYAGWDHRDQGYGEAGNGQNPYRGYNVSPPSTPLPRDVGNYEDEERRLRDEVTRKKDDRQTTATKWSDLY